MTNFERDVLRAMNGEHVPGLIWGAAISQALDALKGAGLISQREALQEKVTP